ncbi:hypothetical protein Aerorivi_04667 (plasmid) [Aeromonas rivipollensis]|uniref:hypothetical protein n=1 Tax=Aeromonas rivipollensis TaxID=948519 RepID=UPI00399D1F38
MLMRSLLALSFVALHAPLHASSSSVEDSELNALSARLRARNLQVDRLQRVSPHLVEVTIKGETVYATPDGNIMLFGQAISFDQNERPTNLTTAALWNKELWPAHKASPPPGTARPNHQGRPVCAIPGPVRGRRP